MVKEILGWVINIQRGNLSLYSKQRLELLSLLEIPTTQHRISVKKLERLISKLCSMQLALTGGHWAFLHHAVHPYPLPSSQ